MSVALVARMCSEPLRVDPVGALTLDGDELIGGDVEQPHVTSTNVEGDEMISDGEEDYMEWRAGTPTLRASLDPRDLPPPTPLAEIRARRLAKEEENIAELRALLSSSGLSTAEVERCFRKEERLKVADAERMKGQLAALRAHLPRRAVKSVLLNVPAVALHTSLQDELPERLRELCHITGLTAERVVIAAPALLGQTAPTCRARYDQLRAALPELDMPSICRRAPRLLGLKVATLHAKMTELREILPVSVDVALVVQRQPTLLLNSPLLLRKKLDLLRAVCSEEEWDALTGSSSFARVLTASEKVINRLRDAPAEADGRPRTVVKIILMTKEAYHEAYAPP